jgi:hypothetical protein
LKKIVFIVPEGPYREADGFICLERNKIWRKKVDLSLGCGLFKKKQLKTFLFPHDNATN